jgi:aspartate/tyrosine/aromatic aminotransferase
MFQRIQPAPPDPILGLTEAYDSDPNPQKINLGVGVYQDAAGTTPILQCVKQAERRLDEAEKTKSYLGIGGSLRYGQFVQQLAWGAEHEALAGKRLQTVQTPGGTGALRVAGDFLHELFPAARIWMSQPTWANHAGIFAAAGVETRSYPYHDAKNHRLDLEGMLAALGDAAAGDVVLLHASCHNPSGIDPSADEWRRIADCVADRGLVPLVDFAYQGFGEGLEEDASGLRELTRPGQELLVCSSFSKNFGLYRERVGALTIVAADSQAAEAALSQVKRCVRANYSNPPYHGAGIVETVLADAQLRAQWEVELAAMRDRINGMRRLLVDTMQTLAPRHDFSFIARQRGMFSFSGLSPQQVEELRSKHSIYVVGSGRINVAGITPSNAERLCRAIASVL